MLDRSALIYTYDGSFDGLMCCVFESFSRREFPLDIQDFRESQPTIYDVRFVETNFEHARRVRESIPKKMGTAALRMVSTGFLYDEGGREMAILRFLRFGLTKGFGRTANMLDNAEVEPLFKMARAVGNESHLFKGFVRFAEHDGALVAVIEPKHYVLPMLKGFFAARYPEECFMLFDKTHRYALVHAEGRTEIVPVEHLEPAEGDEFYSGLWKKYYKSTAIMERANPRCRMTHMPKRFWANMLEMEPETNY